MLRAAGSHAQSRRIKLDTPQRTPDLPTELKTGHLSGTCSTESRFKKRVIYHFPFPAPLASVTLLFRNCRRRSFIWNLKQVIYLEPVLPSLSSRNRSCRSKGLFGGVWGSPRNSLFTLKLHFLDPLIIGVENYFPQTISHKGPT